jgi:hypothetical protein
MTEDVSTLRSPDTRAMCWVALALLACTVSTILYVRLRLLDVPLERDEGEYAYVGQMILDGIPPYKLAYNMKLPGTYLAYAGIMAVFGQSSAGIHLGLLVLNLASMALLFLLARSFFGLWGAAVASSAYGLLALSPAVYGLAAHATYFVVFFELLGLFALMKFQKSRHWLPCLAGGLSFGLAFLMKQPGILFAIFGAAYLLWILLSASPLSLSRWPSPPGAIAILAPLGIYLLGCTLPFLAVCLWMKAAGVFPQFWFWTISYARAYGSVVSVSEGAAILLYMLWHILAAAALLWSMAAFGLAILCRERGPADRRTFLGGLLVFSFLAVCPGLHFRPHYFLLLLPTVALLIALSLSWCQARLAATGRRILFPLLFASLACAQSLYTCRDIFFRLSPREVSSVVYERNAFPETLTVAQYLKQHTRRDDRIAVLGSEPQIYFYSHRLSSTGYLYMYPFGEPQPFARHMQDEMIREIEQNPPAYLVYVSVPSSWQTPISDHLRKWMDAYVARYMEPAGVLQIAGPGGDERVWGALAGSVPIHAGKYISVYRRKPPQ